MHKRSVVYTIPYKLTYTINIHIPEPSNGWCLNRGGCLVAHLIIFAVGQPIAPKIDRMETPPFQSAPFYQRHKLGPRTRLLSVMSLLDISISRWVEADDDNHDDQYWTYHEHNYIDVQRKWSRISYWQITCCMRPAIQGSWLYKHELYKSCINFP